MYALKYLHRCTCTSFPLSINCFRLLFVVLFLIVGTPSTDTHFSPLHTILAVATGIGVLLMLSLVLLLLICLYLRKPKRKKPSDATDVFIYTRAFSAMDEAPDDFYSDNSQLTFLPVVDIRAGENDAHATKLQVVQDKKEDNDPTP